MWVPILNTNVRLGFSHCLRSGCQEIRGQSRDIYEAFKHNIIDVETEARLERWMDGQ